MHDKLEEMVKSLNKLGSKTSAQKCLRYSNLSPPSSLRVDEGLLISSDSHESNCEEGKSPQSPLKLPLYMNDLLLSEQQAEYFRSPCEALLHMIQPCEEQISYRKSIMNFLKRNIRIALRFAILYIYKYN